MKFRTHHTTSAIGGARVPQRPQRETMRGISRDLGPCVYFIRTRDGLVKIGFTGSIADRKKNFGSGWDHVLAVVAGASMEDEHALHERFKEDLVRGREYFRPSDPLMDHVNEIRARLGVDPVSR